MNLIIPGVGTEAGPTYAFDVNSSLTLIDQHDHSPGKGVQITPAGININAPLDFQSNNAINVNTIGFIALGSPNSLIRSLSVAPGSGTAASDLFFTDGSGTSIQVTKSGIVNSTATSIPGESYAAGTFIWTQTQSSLPTTPANFDIGSITLRPNIAATAFGVTLSPPAAISTAYTLLLPTLPAPTSTYFLTLDNVGNIVAGVNKSHGITSAMLASGTQTPVSTVSKSADYTALPSDGMILYDTSGGPHTLTLYTAGSVNAGFTIIVKKTSSDVNALTIAANGGETIDGAATTSIITQNEIVTLVSDGTNWQLQERNYPKGWINGGATVLTGDAGGLSKGVNLYDTVWYRRDGDSMYVRIQYQQTATTGGSGAQGAINLQIPGGWFIDATKLVLSSSTTSSVSTPNSLGTIMITQQDVDNTAFMSVIAKTSTTVHFFGFTFNGTRFFWGNGMAFNVSNQLSVTGIFQVPISGWV